MITIIVAGITNPLGISMLLSPLVFVFYYLQNIIPTYGEAYRYKHKVDHIPSLVGAAGGTIIAFVLFNSLMYLI